jgi:alginate O-acetyltransferase complex protein AlgI
MLFNSYSFLILLAVTLFLYYLPPLRAAQIPILLVSSVIFYGYTQPDLVILLVVSISVNAVAGYLLERPQSPNRKAIAIAGVCANLFILMFFKYATLFARTLGLSGAESSLAYKLLHIPLPLGISFFTFQGISLVVDTYRTPGQYPELTRSFGRYWLNIGFFKAFFPQLVSGPIVKAHEFLPQIRMKTLRDVPVEAAFKSLILGYFLKMVVADNLKDQTAWLADFYFQKVSSLTLSALLVGYSFQIFSDFAGYSLIALGLGRLFGYELPVNFNFPYISRSFSEFWTRWHISLSSFLREYLYIPLGGNRHGPLRTYANLLIVMLLGGFWHGAGWNYALWGLFHGLCLVVERLVGAHRPVAMSPLKSMARMAIVFTAVSFGWLLFKLPTLHLVGEFLKCLFTNSGRTHNFGILSGVFLYGSVVVAWHLYYLLCEWRPRWDWQRHFAPVAYGILMFLILTNSGRPGEFIYFQF